MDRKEIVKVMAGAAYVNVTKYSLKDMEAALLAAHNQGYVLAKIPGRKGCNFFVPTEWRRAWKTGYNACLDEIETIDIGESE